MRTSHVVGYTSHIDGMRIRLEVDLQTNANQHSNRLQVTLRSKGVTFEDSPQRTLQADTSHIDDDDANF